MEYKDGTERAEQIAQTFIGLSVYEACWILDKAKDFVMQNSLIKISDQDRKNP